MQVVLLISFWKLVVLVKSVQCEINTTIKVYFPSIILPPYQNVRLSEQAVYDLRNNLRKSHEFTDFDDDDYQEDDDVDQTPPATTPVLFTTVTSTTTTPVDISSVSITSSSARFLLTWIYLSLLLLSIILTQTNK